MRTGRFNIGTDVGPGQMDAIASDLNNYLDSVVGPEVFRQPYPQNRQKGLFFLPKSMEMAAQKAPNPQKEGFELFRSLVQSHGMILSSYRAPARVIRAYVDSCLNILCNGSLSELPLKKYNDYVDTCKFLGNFPLSYLLAKRDGDGRRIGSSLARYHDRDYFGLCSVEYKRWAKARLLSVKAHTISLWYSILKGKSCCDEVSPSYALDELIKHQKGVTTPNDLDDEKVDSFMDTIKPLLKKLAKFLGKNWESADYGIAQQKACYENSVRGGGTLGLLFSYLGERVDTSLDVPIIEMVCPCCGEVLDYGDSSWDLPVGEMSCRTCRYTTCTYPDADGPDPLIFQDAQKKLETKTIHIPGVGTIHQRKPGLVIDTEAAITTRPSLVRLKSNLFSQDGSVKFGIDGELLHTDTDLKFREILSDEARDLLIQGQLYENGDINTISAAKVVAIKEPIKVRIITKGPGLTNLIATRYQQLLIKALREVPCFRSLGRRICSTDLYDLVANQFKSETPGWSSSDFSGASDCSSPQINERMQEALLAYIPEPYRSAIHASNRMYSIAYPGDDFLRWNRHHNKIAQHEYELLLFSPWTNLRKYARKFYGINLEFPDYICGAFTSVEQKRGTLMGSLTSFPLLCLYVLGIHVLNLRRCGDDRSLWDIINGVLINGDDRLTVSSAAVEESFDGVCQEYGMKLSPGKAYWNQSFANMNSQSYLYRLGNPTDKLFGKGAPSPLYVPYLNMGIYMDKRKTESRDEGKPENPVRLVSTIQALLDSCITDKLACVVLSSFLGRYKTRLQRECRGRNLFVSHSLGGWGVVPPVSWRFEITMTQRKLASKIYHSTPFGWLARVGPLPAQEPSNEVSPIVDRWHNWTKDTPSYNTQFSQFDLKDTPLIGKRKMLQSLRICNAQRPFSKAKGTPYRSSVERIDTIKSGVEIISATSTIRALNELIQGPLEGHTLDLIGELNRVFRQEPLNDHERQQIAEPTKLERFLVRKIPDFVSTDSDHIATTARNIVLEQSGRQFNSPLAKLCMPHVIDRVTAEELASALGVDRKRLASLKV